MKRILLISLLLLCGCGEWTITTEPVKPEPRPKPAPTVHDAGDQASVYLDGVADAFDAAADSYDAHEPSTAINETLGDSQKSARLNAFTPLMEELNATRPASDVSDSEREEYDAKSSALLRKWAAQIRGAK